ncbi:MAG TPA: hypothetical protein VEB03_00010 [Candidatus Nanoarchaeia archaeon]|nr:hypothetical protein [Candidatus Nanoarchaeia archaeon]
MGSAIEELALALVLCIAMVAMLGAIWVLYRTLLTRTAVSDSLLKEKQRALDQRRAALERRIAATASSEKRLEKIISEKRDRFLNIPNVAFHFADSVQIANFYNDYFKEPTIASLVADMTNESDAHVKGSLPQVLESKLGTRDVAKWVSTIRLPETSLNGMFLRYQRETIRSDQVTLGIEEVDIELTELQSFDEAVQALRSSFDLSIDEPVLAKHRNLLRQKAAEHTLVKLEQATGWILVEGRFVIEAEADFFRCVYRHPVNDYLPESAPIVAIVVLLPRSSLETRVANNYVTSIGSVVPLRVYGQVWRPIDRSTNSFTLHLTPLAVY